MHSPLFLICHALISLNAFLQGEEAVRQAYRHEDLAYYIVRPGGLNNNLGGMQGLTIEQGKS
jgi:hypothetical protein